jgi:hypothetical protein
MSCPIRDFPKNLKAESVKKFLSMIVLIIGFSIVGKEKIYIKSTTPTVVYEMNGSSAIDTHSEYHFSYDMFLSNESYNKSENYCYIRFTSKDFQDMFQDTPKSDLLRYYGLYKYPSFREYARILPEYNDFMKQLHERITTDKKFREQTFRVQGFSSSFGLRSQKSGFHDFVAKEVRAIEQLEVLTKAHLLKCEIQNLSNDWLYKQKNTGSNFDYNKRLDNRIQAAEKFMKGDTLAVDKQLRSEVSEIQSRVTTLEKNYSHDRYVKFLTPLVRACAAQAIAEMCPLIDAFQLTDFSYVVTDVLFQGMGVLYDASYSVAKGVSKGVSTVLTVDHWKNMVTGTVQLADMCLRMMVEDEIRNAEYAAARFSPDPGAIMKCAEKHYLQNKQQSEAFNAAASESYDKLKAMSWQEVIENGTEIGTTMILDTLVLNVAGGCVSSANKAFINKISNLTESGAIFTEQYAAEVAGFGKLMIEGGPECATKISNSIKNDLILCVDNQSAAQQARRIICPQKWIEEIAHKIRNIGDDILDIMEKLGGHTLERHVGQTYEELFKRAIDAPGSDAISTFSSKRVAIKSVQENLKNNCTQITTWLQNNPSPKKPKAFEFLHSREIGNGIIKGKKNGVYSLYSSRVVLLADLSSELGFKIVSSFPIV